MPVRLNKALKELNVGINTVAEFLQKKGKVLEDVSINAKLTDEQYELLVNAFGADKSKHEEIKLVNQKRKEKEQKERDERREQQQKEKELKKQQKEEVFRTESERKQSFKVLGNINDVQAKAKADKPAEKPADKPAVTPVETPAEQPAAQTVQTPATAEPEAKKAEPKPVAVETPVAEPAPVATEPAPQPTEPAPQPVEPAPQPEQPAPQPEEPAPQPEQPVEPAPQPEQPVEPAPQPTEPAPQPTEPTPKPTDPAPVPEAQNPLGTSIAQFAASWVGRIPYLYGGNMFYEGGGVDCSHFTYHVYLQYGLVSGYTYSGGQRGWGYGVGLEDIQPGDLVCYDGHVAIYYGNGMVVHAPAPGRKIEIGSLYMAPVRAVRRLY
jgi:cell wall-associated NlpC family hydrolase